MPGAKNARKVEHITSYLLGCIEEKISNLARLSDTPADDITRELGSVLLTLGNRVANSMSSMSTIPTGNSKIRKPEMAMAECTSGKAQSNERKKHKRLIKCDECGKKFKNLTMHKRMAHRGLAKKLAKKRFHNR